MSSTASSDTLPETSPKPKRRRRGRWIAGILLAILLGLGTWFVLHLLMPRRFTASGAMITLELSGGPLAMPYYCGPSAPRGIVILGTGDGGWSYWEENTAKHLEASGYAVGGWDCRKFADSRKFDQATLVEGFTAALEAVREHSQAPDDAPVWFGGWSTGAEQSVAAAASPDRPQGLTGLLLAAPGTRGRYGLTTGDLLGQTPSGPGTFSLAELAPGLKGLRVAQFEAGLDPMDDVKWLQSLTTPWKLIPLPGKLHDMGGAGPEFQQKMDEALAWTLQPNP